MRFKRIKDLREDHDMLQKEVAKILRPFTTVLFRI